MALFQIDLLFQLVKAAVDRADLESLRSPVPTDEYDFESTELTEFLYNGTNATSVDDLSVWLSAYWARQFGAIATEEWLGSRDFRALAAELVRHRKAVDSPEACLQYLQWQRAAGIGYAVTNEELLLLVVHWTAHLAEELYRKWAMGADESGTETQYQYAARRLRRLAHTLGYGEARRAMKQEFLAICLRVDARGFLACLRAEPVSGRYADINLETLQIQLQDCVSLYIEYVLALEPQDGCCDWDYAGTSGAQSIN